MKLATSFLVATVALLILAGCTNTPTMKAGWTDVLRRCASNDVIENGMVYLGPSNDIGPGSIWRPTGDGYNVRRRLEDLQVSGDEKKRVIAYGALSTCQGSAKTTLTLKPSLALGSRLYFADAEVSAALDRARSVSVQVDQWAIDNLVEGPYEDIIFSLPSNHPFRTDALTDGRRVITKAVRVKGLKAELEFDAGAAASAKLKIANGTLAINDVSPSLEAEWSGDGSLRLVSDAEFYIIAQFSRFTAKGVALQGSDLVLTQVPAEEFAVLSEDKNTTE